MNTLINEIDLPDKLESLLQERKIFEEQRKNYQNEELAEKARKSLEIAKGKTKLELTRLKAQAKKEETAADAEAIRQREEVKLQVIEALAEILGPEGYLTKARVEQLGQLKLPDMMYGQNSLIEALLSPLVRSYDGQQLPDEKMEKVHPLLEEISEHLNDNPGPLDADLIVKTLENLSAHFSNIRQTSPAGAHQLPFNSDTKKTTEVDIVDTTIVIEEEEDKEDKE